MALYKCVYYYYYYYYYLIKHLSEMHIVSVHFQSHCIHVTVLWLLICSGMFIK